MPAIQRVLKALGDRALEPLLYLDADSYPLSTRSWKHRMLSGLDQHEASAASGLVYDGKYYLDGIRARREGAARFRGANMATYLQREPVLKRVLELPHIWPGEDCAIELAVKSEGGSSRQVIHPGATVMTSSRYISPLADILTKGRTEARKQVLEQYKQRAATGSIPLGRYLKREARRKKI